MSYSIATCATFMSDLVSAPHNTQKKLTEVMKVLRETPSVQRGKLTKKLLGYAKLWRYALTDPEYRIIYEVDEKSKSVKLMRMGPRKDGKVYIPGFDYTSDKGPSHIPIEVAPIADPEFIIQNPEVLQAVPDNRSQQKSLALPFKLTDEWLKQHQIPPEYWKIIRNCITEDDLLNAVMPQQVKMNVMDCIWPSPIEKVVSQPTYIVEPNKDLVALSAHGELTKLLLNLDEEQQKATDPNMGWPALVKGGPGTGKSVVALYKAAGLINPRQMEIAHQPPKILFTTYSKSLTDASKALFDAYLGERSRQIEIRTVIGVAMKICRSINNDEFEFLESDEKDDIVSNLLDNLGETSKQLPVAANNSDFIIKEFEWVIEGWSLPSFESYRDHSRLGRRIRLTVAQRQIIWNLYESFKKEIKKLNKITYENAQNIALEFILNNKQKNLRSDLVYDYVFVDEVQDLKPVGLRLCAALCKNGTNLYLTADMNQALYGKGVSWVSVVDTLRFTRNTARALKKNYRSTDQLIRATKELLSGIPELDRETVDTEPVYTGSKPLYRIFNKEVERNKAIAQWIKDNLKDLRLSRSCAAILCPTKKCVEEMLSAMNGLGLPSVRFRDDSRDLDKPEVKIMPIHSSKGLEFPVVVVPDFRADAYNWLERDDNEAMVQTSQRFYFVACTRAMKRLLVAKIGQNDELSNLISDENWDKG